MLVHPISEFHIVVHGNLFPADFDHVARDDYRMYCNISDYETSLYLI